MKDQDKSKSELINELIKLRTQVFDLEETTSEHKTTDEAVTESLKRERFWADIVRKASVGVAIGYPDGHLGVSNAAYQKITGYSEKELQTIDWNKILTPPEWEESETAKLQELHRTKKSVQYEKEYIRKDGSRVPIELIVHPQFDSDGNVECYFAFVIDIMDRKKAEEKLEHLSLVLRAIRNVNQLITKEKDRGRLLQGACDNLVETRGYFNTWIALFDESGKLITTAEAGLGMDFLPIIELMKSGKNTTCGINALKKSDVVITEAPLDTCKDCPLSVKYTGRGAMAVRLEYEGESYGLMSVSIPKELVKDEEEQDLFKEVANDIAFAINNLELEKERKQAEEKLKKKMVELEIFHDAAVSREIVINESRKEINELLRKLGKEPKYEIAE